MHRLLIVMLAGCGGGMSPPGSGDDDPPVLLDAPVSKSFCPNGQETKIRFTEQTGCGNDGSVEFCIPEGDTGLRALLDAINPAIMCVAGGGQARCSQPPGRLLCSYPTSFPAECLEPRGAMTPSTWIEMCDIAQQPQIVEIVPTFFR